MKKIDFIILTWNSEKYIEMCVRSIQNMRNFVTHIIVVDNGSVDRTKILLQQLAAQNTETCYLDIVFLNANRGTSVSRNMGFKRIDTTADYICVLDSDTSVTDSAFEELISRLETLPMAGIVGPQLITSSGVMQQSARNFPTLTQKICAVIPINSLQKYSDEKMIPQSLPDNEGNQEVDYLMSACWLFRPSLLADVGYLDEHIFYAPEDAEFCIRVLKAGYKVYFCPKAKIIHEWQRISRRKVFSKNNWEHIKGLMYVFWKYKYLFSTKKFIH